MDMTKEGPVQGMVELEIKSINMKQKELSKKENRKDMPKKIEIARGLPKWWKDSIRMPRRVKP